MTHKQAVQELVERLRPWNNLRAKVMMSVPVDYVLSNGDLTPSPRPSDGAKNLLKQIDEMTRIVIADIEKQFSHIPWVG